MLVRLGCFVPTLEEAQVVIIHASLGQTSDVLRAMPGLANKYLVGYLVWEADRLPPQAAPIVRYMDEVWTPTWYSAKSFVPWARVTRWLPHVVRRPLTPSQEAIGELHQLLGEPSRCAMVQIGQTTDPRKNLRETAQAFEAACVGRPGLTLVQKLDVKPDAPKPSSFTCARVGNVIQLRGFLSEDGMAALYARSAYVLSPHHGEGWGLTLSEGMARGTVPVASNYSGNLAFMAPSNSILIDGYEAEIRPADHSSNFKTPMRWHYSYPGHIEAAIGRAYDLIGTDAYAAMAAEGRRISRVYHKRRIQLMMRAYLQAIAASGALSSERRPKAPYRPYS